MVKEDVAYTPRNNARDSTPTTQRGSSRPRALSSAGEESAANAALAAVAFGDDDGSTGPEAGAGACEDAADVEDSVESGPEDVVVPPRLTGGLNAWTEDDRAPSEDWVHLHSTTPKLVQTRHPIQRATSPRPAEDYRQDSPRVQAHLHRHGLGWRRVAGGGVYTGALVDFLQHPVRGALTPGQNQDGPCHLPPERVLGDLSCFQQTPQAGI
mmetsp:Transcript_18126/g.44990  ORF Transcript_18126/g.44990 Transcript_18126/m.44990 type:complete len:211 (+) Transcript_18126:155-787(+)